MSKLVKLFKNDSFEIHSAMDLFFDICFFLLLSFAMVGLVSFFRL